MRSLATSAAGTTSTFAVPGGMVSDRPSPGYDRVLERCRAVALARHFREAEDLSVGEIAERLGRSPATVKAYFYDPTGEKARAVKARYLGVCRECGAYTQPRNGKGDAYAYCKACHPGAIKPQWTGGSVLAAMREWRERYGRLPTSYDWSSARGLPHARRRASTSRGAVSQASPAIPRLSSNSISHPKPRESTAKSDNPIRGLAEAQPRSLQGLLPVCPDFAHYSGR
jgi:AraC-like DNA-binding protein